MTFAPKEFTYWGIYYSKTGKPNPWGAGELEEKGGSCIQTWSGFKYETEPIKDNWFYYQCWSR